MEHASARGGFAGRLREGVVVTPGAAGIRSLLDEAAGLPTADLLRALLDEDDPHPPLVSHLRNRGFYSLARALLLEAARRDGLPPERAELVRQQRALCLYKDPDLPAKGKLDDAFAVLDSGSSLARTRDPETLGLAGAISRRYWDLDGHSGHLERALRYYRRGHRLFMADDTLAPKDKGYTGINAAFVIDQLAWLSAKAADRVDEATSIETLQREQARQIRIEVVERLEGLRAAEPRLAGNWWVVATLIEAHFGLGRFDRATEVFRQWGGEVAGWMVESTLKQLVALARLHGHVGPGTDATETHPARACLRTILGDRDARVLLTADQKVGLALSGGGFRASFYEIGVLAALAEFDLLRHVEVLSTVSGGSILGAHYYLELRHLLETRRGADITRDDYVDVVRRVATEFFAGVEKNIRTRVVLNPLHTLRMYFSQSYSRTMKAGELYERHIYSRARGVAPGPIPMHSLLISPLGESAGGTGTQAPFNPRAENWHRAAKVPVLVINATSLNTGHNWQFTASWMGEPLVETDIDSNPRLRRMYYRDLEGTPAARHADLRLGHAVAASACVPGLFEPLALVSLYEDSGSPTPGRTTVRLVDGGVHDNQGIGSLLEQDCNVLIVADASGQMTYEREPSPAVVGGVLRSNSALMARIREAQYRDVKVQREVERRKGLAFVHLKADLHAAPVNWHGCQQVKDGTEDPRTLTIAEPITSYGIRKSAQDRLAALRTDLDSFSEIEAHALMYSGYCATREIVPKTIDTLSLSARTERDWPFLRIAAALTEAAPASSLARTVERHLEVGSRGFLKVWYLHPALTVLGGGLLGVLGTWLLWWSYGKDMALVRLDTVWWAAMGAVITWALGKWALRLARPQQFVSDVATGLALALVGWLVALVHLSVFDRLFRRLGRLPRR
jgi:predicted acylesterase/phospholipase RssA